MFVLGTLQMLLAFTFALLRQIFLFPKRTSPIHEAFALSIFSKFPFALSLLPCIIKHYSLWPTHHPTLQVDRLSTLHEQRLALLENEFESELRLVRSEFDAELHGIQVCACLVTHTHIKLDAHI
jgi:hypothetical protein